MTDEKSAVEPLSDEKLGWVQDSLAGTGFLLEHRVYEKVRAHNLNAFLGPLYTDPNTGIGRELDVIVRESTTSPGAGVLVWSSVLIECKNYREPVVVIGKPREKLWRPRSFEEAAMTGDPIGIRSLDDGPVFGSAPAFLDLRSLPASVEQGGFMGNQMVLLERNKSAYKATNAGVHDSVIIPLAKAMAYEQRVLLGRELAASGIPGNVRHPSVVLSFPILVTAGPVVEAEPDGPSVDVREVPWTRVVRTFSDSSLPSSIVIEVVQEDALDDWVTNRLRPYVDQVISRLVLADRMFTTAQKGGVPSTELLEELRSQFNAPPPQ